MWKFGCRSPSRVKVDIDPFSESLEKSVRMRDSLYNVNPAHSYIPDTEGTCECGVRKMHYVILVLQL